jgi:tripartite-type tricarboxylate transporter receptor subunit TctC
MIGVPPGTIRIKALLLPALLAALYLTPFGTSPAWGGTAPAAVPDFMPYPGGDVVVINPYGPGDETGLLLEALRPHYRLRTGRDLAVSSITGRGGATGWNNLASRPGDGYTLAATNLENAILRPMASRPIFAADDLYHICIMAEAPLTLWVPEESPFARLGDFVRSAKAYPRQLIIGGAGSGTTSHLTSLRLDFLSGVKTTYLPYMGTANAIQAAKAGQVHAVWGYPLAVLYRRMGMRPLAVAAPQRAHLLADTPTFEEMNIGLFVQSNFGLALPGSAPPNVRQQVSAVYQGLISAEPLRKALLDLGFTPKSMAAQELNQRIKDETARFAELILDYPME